MFLNTDDASEKIKLILILEYFRVCINFAHITEHADKLKCPCQIKAHTCSTICTKLKSSSV